MRGKKPVADRRERERKRKDGVARRSSGSRGMCWGQKVQRGKKSGRRGLKVRGTRIACSVESGQLFEQTPVLPLANCKKRISNDRVGYPLPLLRLSVSLSHSPSLVSASLPLPSSFSDDQELLMRRPRERERGRSGGSDREGKERETCTWSQSRTPLALCTQRQLHT